MVRELDWCVNQVVVICIGAIVVVVYIYIYIYRERERERERERVCQHGRYEVSCMVPINWFIFTCNQLILCKDKLDHFY